MAILAELCGLPGAERDFVLDVSVGYSLDGIRSRKIAGFFEGVRDASALLDRERVALRRELPPSLRRFADVPCEARLSDSVTLSTFHGCPADEIAAISRHLLSELGLHTIVKLNPTLLGYEEVEEILHRRLGYTQHRPPPAGVRSGPEVGRRPLDRPRAVGRGRPARPRFRREAHEHARRRESR